QTAFRRALSPPSACHWNKNLRQLRDKHRLLFRLQHQISITLLRMRERAENSAVHAKVRSALVRTFFRSIKTQRNPTKILYRHCHFSLLFSSDDRSCSHLATTN